MEGQALECLGRVRLMVTFGTRAIDWDIIVAEIGEDEGILGNHFAVAHQLTVWPHEGAVYLSRVPTAVATELWERLTWFVHQIMEVRAITEETLAVRTTKRVTIAPMAMCQMSMNVPASTISGSVKLEPGPGPLVLYTVQGVTDVNQETKIWLANSGSQASAG